MARPSTEFEHAVIGAPGVQLKDVRKVMSHPVALAQCEHFFHTHPEMQPVPEYDTAGAVEKVIRENLRDCAAIAGSRVAEIFGGVVLADKIQDHVENYARFLLVSPKKRDVDDSVRNKTNSRCKTRQQSGFAISFVEALRGTRNRPHQDRKPSDQEFTFRVPFLCGSGFGARAACGRV